MVEWRFYLDDLEIEEPIGFPDLELSVSRDDKLHGMQFEASTSLLEFYGDAAVYLKGKKELEGVRATVIFTAESKCEGQEEFEEVLSGRLNFGKYKAGCGTVCSVSMPWEEQSCQVILKSRYDQKIDMDKPTAVDNFTPLMDYPGLSMESDLPAHNLKAATEGYVVDDGDVIDMAIFTGFTQNFVVRPTYGREIYANINESQLFPSVFAASDNGFNDPIISPVLLFDDEIECFSGEFTYDVRLKGSYNYGYTFGSDFDSIRLVVAYGEYPGSLTILHTQALPFTANIAVGTFDYSYSGVLMLPPGQGFYVYFESKAGFLPAGLNGTITFDKETYVNIEGVKSCPTTQAELYMIHETLSRLTESLTNGCVRAKSSYYGRTDSQPFSFLQDGCGGLRSVTSGLKIRRAPEDRFFLSPKDLIEGLNAIDNIGMDVIPDPDIDTAYIMRVEAVDFFYQELELLRHDAIPEGDENTEEMKHYSKVEVGYKKWEVERINGLDEFNSNHVYNTSIDTINSTLDITSNLVAGTYPIELTRQQSFADSGAADTRYDNETFVISMKRDTYPYGMITVEQDAVDNPSGVFSPETMYNWRLSPARNLMRWYKTIAAGFANLNDSDNQLYFTSGTGNLIAKAILTDEACRSENTEIQENQNIFVTLFEDSNIFTPLWRNELLTYEYPMSLKDYREVKLNPYGYISSQCGDGDFKKYWIKEIKFKPAKGTATFVLREKYGI